MDTTMSLDSQIPLRRWRRLLLCIGTGALEKMMGFWRDILQAATVSAGHRPRVSLFLHRGGAGAVGCLAISQPFKYLSVGLGQIAPGNCNWNYIEDSIIRCSHT